MHALRFPFVFLAVALSLAGCSHVPQPTTKGQPTLPVALLTANPPALFQQEHPLLTKRHFDQVLIALRQFARQGHQQQVDTLLYYLRAYSYFGEHHLLTPPQQQQLHQSLLAVARMPDFANSPRLWEHYAVTLYRYFDQPQMQPLLTEHWPHLYERLATIEFGRLDERQMQFALWEGLRAYGILAFAARRSTDEPLKQQLADPAIAGQFIALAQRALAQEAPDWVIANSLWVLANHYQLIDEDSQTALDERLLDLMDLHISNPQRRQQLFTRGYLVNTFRGKSACEEKFAGYCQLPDLDEELPLNHQCSPRLFIRARKLTEAQLQASCRRLTAQEADFHQLLATNEQPVANDFNRSLRVVIFDNWSQYHGAAQLLFDINTDNGGMYIEGTPSDPANQASFFAFRASWLAPTFKVWNLNHEYVHYLDGRFASYGPFQHFPSHMVWWSEGLAEYIAKGKHNDKASALLREQDPADWPDLATIFETRYEDGLDRTYRWSYLAIRFLAETRPDALPALRTTLRNDFFDGYRKQLDQLADAEQAAFAAWLAAYPGLAADKALEQNKIRKINRYAYPGFLMPVGLASQAGHQRL